MDYHEFIAGKSKPLVPAGFDCPPDWLPAGMFGFQREVTLWALKLGRAALFLDTGLGKSLCELAWAAAVVRHTGKPVLLLTPLAVGPQMVREAVKFGIADVTLAEKQADVDAARVWVTNYQKLHKFDPAAFAGIVLDESGILKSFVGKVKQALCAFAASIPYRLCGTATPAPNDHMELGNHSAFLGVMDSDEMLTRWFINNPAEAGDYRLKRHGEADFWRWVASWACCVSKPSDLGYSDDGYDLPELRIVEHIVEVDTSSPDSLFRTDKLNATNIHREKRLTAAARAAHVAGLVAAEPDEPWLIWCDTDYEADELTERIPAAVEVRGSHPEKRKVKSIVDYLEGRVQKLVSKPTVCGYGLNLQHCARIAFVGTSYSWEQFYQAYRRCWRFSQTRPVDVHVVCAETELSILRELKRKAAENDALRSNMTAAVRESWRDQHQQRRLTTTYTPTVQTGNGWELRLGDCVQELKAVADDSIDFTIFSPPFSNLYIYSDSAFDMGNAVDDDEFYAHFRYLIPELLRVTVPGRLCAVHCKDLPLYRNRDGSCGLKDFPGDVRRLFSEAGWIFHSRITIWKCPVVERERTNNNGLLHATAVRDSSQCRQGMADYLLVFRKNPIGDNLSAKPIVRPNGFEEWPGDPECDPRTQDAHPSKYARKGMGGRFIRPDAASIAIWQRLADPVWFHIDQRDVLNYEAARDGDDERHIAPLQLGVVKEAVYLWTNPGDLVLSPFAGIGSEGYESLLLGRRFLGIELKPSYFDVAAKNLTHAASQANQKSLFDLIDDAA